VRASFLSFLVVFCCFAFSTTPAFAVDSDGDGLDDDVEVAIGSDPANPDSDRDLVRDGDEAPGGNPVDSDADGLADILDTDDDGDGIATAEEDVDLDRNPLSDDTDADGTPNYLDTDDDGDGVPTATESAEDRDADGTPNYLDTDDDGDGIETVAEDVNGNGTAADDDTDSDGTPDYLDSDDDGDGIPTASESTGDTDGDGTPDYLDPLTDSDGDGLDDGDERDVYGTDPFDPDSDGDGLDDGTEIAGPTDALDADSDDDGLGDGSEADAGLDPFDPDSDGDGLDDGLELGLTAGIEGGTSGGSGVPFDGTDPAVFVPDGDPTTTTLALDPDSDGDGLDDGTEDADRDGVRDPDETDPIDDDSDGDGFGDGTETTAGSDPLDPNDTPETVNDPVILAIVDVPNDQGRRVRIRWSPSRLDTAGSTEPIVSYGIYRRVDDGALARDAEPARHATAPGVWDFVRSVPATAEADYSALATTLCDSTESGVCLSTFFVRAQTGAPAVFHDSAPDSGYSVDDLAPNVPANLSVSYDVSGNTLTWDESLDEDFRYFRVYRSSTPDFEPTTDVLVRSTTGAGWTDTEAAGPGVYYAVTAVDFAGNESEAATVTATGVDAPTPRRAALLANTPNPFNPSTSLRFFLPEAREIELTIYDAAGRRVRTLARGPWKAGEHTVQWNGRDDRGGSVASGVYLYRLRAGDFERTRRMTLLK